MTLLARNPLLKNDPFFNHFFASMEKESASNETKKREKIFSPHVDIHEQSDRYELHAELPGIKKEDIHVSLNDGVLTLKAEAQQEKKESTDGRIIRQERRYGTFMRSFNLGDDVHQEDISANFENGVLSLIAPKREEKTPLERKIEIQ